MRKLMMVALLAACGGADVPEMDPPGCPGCAIVLDTVVVLDFADAPASPFLPINVVPLSDGGWLVANAYGGSAVQVFSRDGRYRRTLMPRGRGPGEAWSVTAAWLDGDTLWTWDAGNLRCSSFDFTLTLVRDQDCPRRRATDVVAVRGGWIAHGPPAPTPLRFVQEDGHVAFGPDTLPTNWDFGSIAPADGGVWWNPGTTYRLELWAPGERSPRRVIERQPAWWRRLLPEQDQFTPLDGPMVWGIWQENGLVWTASYIAHSKDFGIEQFISLDSEPYVYTVVEALTSDGDLVASGMFALGVAGFTNEGLLVAAHGTPSGHKDIGVYRPRVVVTNP